jgi:hypothetical protein
MLHDSASTHAAASIKRGMAANGNSSNTNHTSQTLVPVILLYFHDVLISLRESKHLASSRVIF